MERLAKSPAYCGLILAEEGPFSAYMSILPLHGYSVACINDVCAVSGDVMLMRAASCNSLQDLELECKAVGGLVGEWRPTTHCRKLIYTGRNRVH